MKVRGFNLEFWKLRDEIDINHNIKGAFGGWVGYYSLYFVFVFAVHATL